MNSRISQIRTDALTAEFIYTTKLGRIAIFSGFISLLTIVLPILMTSALLIAKGTPSEALLNGLSIAMGAVLLSLAVCSLIFRLDQKRENYLTGRRSNLYVANESLRMMDENSDKLMWFFNYVVEMDSKDQEFIGRVSEGLRRKSYRHALMRLVPGSSDVVCAACKASPFVFKKGDCQVCGNKPRSEK